MSGWQTQVLWSECVPGVTGGGGHVGGPGGAYNPQTPEWNPAQETYQPHPSISLPAQTFLYFSTPGPTQDQEQTIITANQ